MIAGIVLAAGRGARFGSDKLLHVVHGKPLLSYCIETCLDSRLPHITLVLGPEPSAEKTRVQLPSDDRLRIIHNEYAYRGQMSSLKTGLVSLGGEYDAAMVCLADMPFVTVAIVNRLIDTFQETDSIVIPEKNRKLRHPRVIPRRLFPHFLRLGDNEKGSKVIDTFASDVVTVNVGEEKNYADIDYAADIALWESGR